MLGEALSLVALAASFGLLADTWRRWRDVRRKQRTLQQLIDARRRTAADEHELLEAERLFLRTLRDVMRGGRPIPPRNNSIH